MPHTKQACVEQSQDQHPKLLAPKSVFLPLLLQNLYCLFIEMPSPSHYAADNASSVIPKAVRQDCRQTAISVAWVIIFSFQNINETGVGFTQAFSKWLDP